MIVECVIMWVRFPHTRGGVPGPSADPADLLLVFPTHVGVYLTDVVPGLIPAGFPHTRGGVPVYPSSELEYMTFSPHTWGCT